MKRARPRWAGPRNRLPEQGFCGCSSPAGSTREDSSNGDARWAPRAQVVLDLGEDRLDHAGPSLTSGVATQSRGLDPRRRQGEARPLHRHRPRSLPRRPQRPPRAGTSPRSRTRASRPRPARRARRARGRRAARSPRPVSHGDRCFLFDGRLAVKPAHEEIRPPSGMPRTIRGRGPDLRQATPRDGYSRGDGVAAPRLEVAQIGMSQFWATSPRSRN
jgi:hypothetical protein